MTKYMRTQSPEGRIVILKDNDLWIPSDTSNTDYQAFLAWVAEGNTAEVVES